MSLIIGWITWTRVGDGEKEEIRDMLAIPSDNGVSLSKRAVRRRLTDQYQEAGKGIRKMTLRRYTARPCWLSSSTWARLNPEVE